MRSKPLLNQAHHGIPNFGQEVVWTGKGKDFIPHRVVGAAPFNREPLFTTLRSCLTFNSGHRGLILVSIVELQALSFWSSLCWAGAGRCIMTTRFPYPSDVNDQKWVCIAPHVAQKQGPGRKRTINRHYHDL
jgi:hypothetical protein